VYLAQEFAAFEKDCIESIVYHEVGRYKTYSTLKRHYESARLTDQDIDFLLRDILGEAG
jgi:predicted SprT family Zn-dependent metalloprotease